MSTAAAPSRSRLVNRWLGIAEGMAFLGIIAGALLRWTSLGKQSLWFDEGLTTWLMSLQPGELARMVRADVSAPLYFIVLHGWSVVFGMSEEALRGFSALMATLSLVLLYLLGRRVLKAPWVACAATWFFAFSTFQIQYALEARYYALLGFECLLALYCACTYLDRPSPGAMAGVVLASAAALYTHNAALYYLLGLNLFWLIDPSELPLRRRVRDLVLTDGLIGLIYLPWVPTVIVQVRWAAANFWAQRPGGWDLVHALSMLGGGRPYALASLLIEWTSLDHVSANAVAAIVVIIAAIAVAIALALSRGPVARLGLGLGIYALLPVGLAYGQSMMSKPIFMDRIFIASTPALALLLVMPLLSNKVLVKIAGTVLVMVLLAISAASDYGFTRFEQKEQWREAYQYISTLSRQGTLLVFCAPEGEVVFNYYESRDLAGAGRFARTGTPNGFFELDPPLQVRKLASEVDLAGLKGLVGSGKYRQVVLIYAHELFADPKRLTEAYLEQACELVEIMEFDRVRVFRYEAGR